MLLALKTEEDTSKSMGSPLELSEGTLLCQLLDFSPGRPISDF
ncbi:hypothetical protein Cadr_000007478 [Camelus dromedarius]|uniref:Uncharacterized protein n=1 Tax=Camelus dromedarius TaxID=9838 RepID=A0A5N4E634_CAMDR|nr:hypothetical protein Cadr_000007478 [Camelus dromedarius]